MVKGRRLVFKGIAWVVMLLALAVTLFPIYWLVITSIAPGEVVMTYPPHFIPTKITLEWWAYTVKAIRRPLINSLIISGTVAVTSSLVGLVSGYGFARFRRPDDSVLFWILSIRFMPAIVAVIAYYLLFSKLNLLDTYIAVIVPHLSIGIPFAVWMMRGIILSIPRELEEAALVDGCSRIGAVFKIVFPLALPGFLVTMLFTFIWSWSEFMYALVLTDVNAVVLTVTIAGMREAHGLMWGAVSAAALIATTPILALAVLLQKYLVSSLAFYGVRG